jgi:hypothetical protein
MHIIVIILWATLSLLAMIENAPYCKNLSPMDSFVVFIIFALGGPIFALNTVLTMILSLILPEGWDDDDDDSPKY